MDGSGVGMSMVEVITFEKHGSGGVVDRAECDLDAVALTAGTLWDDATSVGIKLGHVGVYVEGKLARMFTHPPFPSDLIGISTA